MKITYRIPNKPDMFAYLVEVEADAIKDTPNTEESRVISDGYKVFSEAFKTSTSIGLSEKQMDSIVETMCLGDNVEGGVDLYANMTPDQKKETQRLKRALDRISRKENIVDFEEPERDLESN